MSDRLNWQPPDWRPPDWGAPPPPSPPTSPPTVEITPPGHGWLPPVGGPGSPPPPPPPGAGKSSRVGIAVVLVVAVLVGFLGVSVMLNRRADQRSDRFDRLFPETTTPDAPANPFNPFSPGSGNPGSGNPGGGNPGAGSPSTTVPADTAAIAAKVEDAAVDITTSVGYGNGQAAGTGMLIASSGEVLTNNHVIAGATAITVQINGQGQTYTARILGTDRTDDVALLKIDNGPTFKTVKTGNPSSLNVGDPVVALGNSLGRGGPLTVRSGTVSALDQTATASDPSTGSSETLNGLIQTTAPLQPGDSGGPLVNAAGQVVGMNTAASLRNNRFNATTGLSFAIPITKAMSIAADIRAGRASDTVQVGQPGFIGVQVSPTLTVTRVVAGMPAEAAGLHEGDRILTVEGKPLTTSNSLTEALNLHRTGDTVTLTWLDQQGRTQTGKMKLVAGPPS